jgi:hypothetical protein
MKLITCWSDIPWAEASTGNVDNIRNKRNFFIYLKIYFFKIYFYLSFYSFSLAQRKRTKRDIHPHQTSPYMGRLRSGADNAALYTKVKMGIKTHFLEFIKPRTRLLRNDFDVLGGDAGEGGAEEGEAEEDEGFAGEAGDFALKALERATDDADAIAYTERGGDKIHRAVGIAEHKTEHLHLTVRNDRQGVDAIGIRGTGLVGQEITDIRQMDYLQSLLFRQADEDTGRNQDMLNLLLSTILPDMLLLLAGHIGLKACLLEFLANEFLGIAVHDGDKPEALFSLVRYAYGVVNAKRCRTVFRNFRRVTHVKYTISGCKVSAFL